MLKQRPIAPPTPQRISDIPSLRKLRGDAAKSQSAGRVMRFASRPLKMVGIDLSARNALGKSDHLRKVVELVSLPDRFNDLYADAPYCWIVYDSFNTEVALRAVELGESGRLEAGNDLLLSHYSDQLIEQKLEKMAAVRAFQPRMRLAELALEDFKHGRYHACVPMVIALADGLIGDLSNHQQALFDNDAILVVPDSITAHPLGLRRLVDVLSRSRRRLTETPIRVPYRNGIVHGTDLGYDNREVAVKTWALLFAVRELALRLENPRQAVGAAAYTRGDFRLSFLELAAKHAGRSG